MRRKVPPAIGFGLVCGLALLVFVHARFIALESIYGTRDAQLAVMFNTLGSLLVSVVSALGFSMGSPKAGVDCGMVSLVLAGIAQAALVSLFWWVARELASSGSEIDLLAIAVSGLSAYGIAWRLRGAATRQK